MTDTLGSAIALTNSTGAVNTTYAYEPFGNVTVSGTANANSTRHLRGVNRVN